MEDRLDDDPPEWVLKLLWPLHLMLALGLFVLLPAVTGMENDHGESMLWHRTGWIDGKGRSLAKRRLRGRNTAGGRYEPGDVADEQ